MRHKLIVLLIIIAYSQLLAPDVEQIYHDYVLAAVKSFCLSTVRFIVLVDEVLEILLTNLTDYAAYIIPVCCILINSTRSMTAFYPYTRFC